LERPGCKSTEKWGGGKRGKFSIRKKRADPTVRPAFEGRNSPLGGKREREKKEEAAFPGKKRGDLSAMSCRKGKRGGGEGEGTFLLIFHRGGGGEKTPGKAERRIPTREKRKAQMHHQQNRRREKEFTLSRRKKGKGTRQS